MHTPPPIALLLTVGFIIFLFRRDFREEPKLSGALWLPLIWMFLLGSRFVSQWLNIFGFSFGATALEEGSPLDALVFLVLLLAGLHVLWQRRVTVSEFIRYNRCVSLFLLYCFLSILWSDFPFVSFKRWIKVLGHPIMALVLYTEPDPEQSLKQVMKWTGYILVPVSVLFIKYFPDLGRGFDQWTGQPVNTGITSDKNALGHDCMVLGLFFIWYALQVWRWEKTVRRRDELILCGLFLGMIWWLLSMAGSMTSSLSMLLGIMVVLFAGLRWVNRRYVGVYLFLLLLCFVVAEAGFGASTHLVHLVGRNPTLTGRTELWQELMRFPINPVLGTGFESFWLGERFNTLAAGHWWQPNQAHNGYLETYLNLGVVGLFLMVTLLLVGLVKANAKLVRYFELGRLLTGMLVMVMVYNWTEAAFKGLSFVWFVFFIVVIDYPQPEVHAVDELVETGQVDEDMVPVSSKG